jgi:hypothetical protein
MLRRFPSLLPPGMSVPIAACLLVLAVVHLHGVDAATCPAASPLFPTVPSWAAPVVNTATDNAPNVTPYAEFNGETIDSLTIDTVSAVAKASGTRIFVAATVESSEVYHLRGGNALTTNSVPSYSNRWVTPDATGWLPVAVDETTGKVYAATGLGDIYQLLPDNTTSMYLSQTNFRDLYLAATGIVSTNPADTLPSRLAFDANGKLFIGLNAFGPDNPPLLSVYEPAAGATPAKLTPITGSAFFYPEPYTRQTSNRYPVRPGMLTFRAGYLYIADRNEDTLYRTLKPYSAFTSAADLDQNPFITQIQANGDDNLLAAAIDRTTGTVYAASSK